MLFCLSFRKCASMYGHAKHREFPKYVINALKVLGIKLKSPTILQGVIEVERTFVYLKPDAIYRGLIGEIIHRFENKGLKIVLKW